MPPSPARVAALHLAGEAGEYWQKALPELQQVGNALEALARKPDDEALLRRTLKLVNKAVYISVWVRKAFPSDVYASHLVFTREVSTQAKSTTLDVEAAKNALARYKESLQGILNSTAPVHFTQEGFRFDNPEHLPWSACRVVVEGFAFLKTIFQKRGVLAVLAEGVRRVVIDPSPGASAFFDSRTREMTVSTHDLAKVGRFSDTFAGETIIHEFGHFIHRNFITGEAAAAWDAPWAGIPSLADPQNQHLRSNPDRARKLDSLDIVTDYGKVDQYEDFAETFMVFMIAPQKLSPTATYRMQRALSLSGLYGKPIMRLGYTIQVERPSV